MVLVRQRPGSAAGVVFMTIEDETGVANSVIWPKVLERMRKVVMGARLVVVHGRVQRHEDIIHVVAERLEDRSDWLRLLDEEADSMSVPVANADEVKRPDPGSWRSPPDEEQAPFPVAPPITSSGRLPPASHHIPAGTRAATPAPSASSPNPATSISRVATRAETRYAARMMQTAPRILLAVSLALVLAFGAGTDTRAYDRPEGSSGFTQKTLAKAKRHMVVAANPLAAEAGLAILRKGGSAVDAAIAVQMVLNVVEPQSSGLGGGAFLLTWDQATKTLLNIDGRETAPEAATPDLFLDAAGKPLPFKQAVESGRSVGVPGVLAALKLAHDKYGKLPWAELFAPAITLARDGFQVSPRLAKLLAESDPASFAARGPRLFLRPCRTP